MNWLRTLLTPLACLPFGALYGLSSLAAPILHHVFRYRLGVVRDNLAACFPELSASGRRKIEKDFYRNFTDNVVETLKLMHVTDRQMEERMTFEGTEIIDGLLDRGKSIIIYFAHVFCWEWAPSVTLHTRHKSSDKVAYGQVYRPLRSRAFDSLMLQIRSRFGSHSFPKSTVLRDLLRLRKAGALSVTGFMSDQHPSHGDPGHFTTLLGRPTLMITGTETLARRMGMAALYWDMERTSRGHYKITVRRLTDDASQTVPGELTETYTRLLETTVRRDPALWLWSHKRWKKPAIPHSVQNVQPI